MNLASNDLPFQLPSDHVRVLHGPADAGSVAVAMRRPGWVEATVPVRDLARYVEGLPVGYDVYLSQCRFQGRRRIVNLLSLNALWLDLDYFRADSALSESAALLELLCSCPDFPPSYVLATGRGLAAVWLVELLPRQALPRWNAVQAELVDRFSCRLGADPAARDAARVLRLAGTFNTRCSPSRRVRCLYPEVGVPEVYRFDDVCDWILPLSREQYRARKREAWDREKRERKAARAGQRRLAVVDADAAGRLWEARLADLQRLRDLRWWGLLPPGHRDVWLFLSSCALAWMAPSAVVRREVVELGRQAIGGAWPAREVEGLMGTALRRAEAAGRGETVTYEGVEVDPRYRFRTSTILDWLSIEPDEQRSMRTLFGPEERARRRSAHQAARGRRSGEKRREALGERDREIVRLRAEEGLSQRQIAERLGVSRGAVLKALRRSRVDPEP